MITIFNRKEVLITFSMEAQAKARTLLAQNEKGYVVSTSDHSVSMRSVRGMSRFESNAAMSCEYCIYVNKKNYETAVAVLEGRI